jgi:hypothetical protein
MRSAFVALLLASPAAAADTDYSWRTAPDDTDHIYLYQDGKQVGGWCYSKKHFRSFDGKDWGSPTSKAPAQPPANRLVIVTPPNLPAAMVQPAAPVPRLRGPLRNRAANVFAQTIAEGTMRVVEEIPGAIWDSIKTGNFKLTVNPPTVQKP